MDLRFQRPAATWKIRRSRSWGRASAKRAEHIFHRLSIRIRSKLSLMLCQTTAQLWSNAVCCNIYSMQTQFFIYFIKYNSQNGNCDGNASPPMSLPHRLTMKQGLWVIKQSQFELFNTSNSTKRIFIKNSMFEIIRINIFSFHSSPGSPTWNFLNGLCRWYHRRHKCIN